MTGCSRSTTSLAQCFHRRSLRGLRTDCYEVCDFLQSNRHLQCLASLPARSMLKRPSVAVPRSSIPIVMRLGSGQLGPSIWRAHVPSNLSISNVQSRMSSFSSRYYIRHANIHPHFRLLTDPLAAATASSFARPVHLRYTFHGYAYGNVRTKMWNMHPQYRPRRSRAWPPALTVRHTAYTPMYTTFDRYLYLYL